MTSADKYIAVLQKRFPNLTIKWNPPPDPIFELNTCTLEFSPKSKPDIVYPVPFPNGLGPGKVEDDIAVFIRIHGEQLDSL
jgi:hypothetical protein